MLVLTDDDKEGQKYRDTIKKIGGVYGSQNVFTIRDLVPTIILNGTIEDCLGVQYVESKFKSLYKAVFNANSSLILNDTTPFLEQIKVQLNIEQVDKKSLDDFLDKLKISLSNNLVLKKTYHTNFPLLHELAKKVQEYMQK